MTGKLAGYANTCGSLKREFEAVRFHGREAWGLMDAYARHRRKKYVISIYGNAAKEESLDVSGVTPTVGKDPGVLQDGTQRRWLYQHPFIQEMMSTGGEVERYELIDNVRPEAPMRVGDKVIERPFVQFLNTRSYWSGGRKYYLFKGVFDDENRRERNRTEPYLIKCT